ncbi:hypothetical protein KI809_04350 [Geobacter pelophilus]|uniref:Uncharacterized protein n=1 Tax=Geoanaerobacter pelophilus TaxID=60036 RepID=A0AAW4L029_9BACT|nr:hypothetical protein [Geoanaerobacter pelophilus]MBT0663527.1 hypothetical protein [Geoanaerobacter pelophilus]
MSDFIQFHGREFHFADGATFKAIYHDGDSGASFELAATDYVVPAALLVDAYKQNKFIIANCHQHHDDTNPDSIGVVIRPFSETVAISRKLPGAAEHTAIASDVPYNFRNQLLYVPSTADVQIDDILRASNGKSYLVKELVVDGFETGLIYMFVEEVSNA